MGGGGEGCRGWRGAISGNERLSPRNINYELLSLLDTA